MSKSFLCVREDQRAERNAGSGFLHTVHCNAIVVERSRGRMPSIRERSTAPPKRLIVRIAIAIGFVMSIYLYASHVIARHKVREESADHILSLLQKGDASQGLAEAVSAQRGYGNSPALARATWAALMAGGGRA